MGAYNEASITEAKNSATCHSVVLFRLQLKTKASLLTLRIHQQTKKRH